MTAASRRTEASGALPLSAAPATGQDAGSLTAALYRSYYGPLVRWARVSGADRAMAEDAVQAAFVTVHRRLDRRHEIKNERAYLHAVVRNEVASMKSRWRETPAPEEWLIAWAGAEPSTREKMPEGSPAYEALRSLPPRQREVLALTVDGYRSSEIAKILGMRDATVRVHLHQARKRAQASLAAEEYRTADAA